MLNIMNYLGQILDQFLFVICIDLGMRNKTHHLTLLKSEPKRDQSGAVQQKEPNHVLY